MMENAPVFQSQVGEQLLALRSFGLRAALVAVSQDARRFEREIGARLRAAGIDITLVSRRNFLLDLLGVAGAVRRLRRRADVHGAYVRGLWGPVALALAGFGRVPHVYDVRGSPVDEARAVGARPIKLAIYRALEAWGIRRARTVTAVSRPLAAQLQAGLRVSVTAVIPCCIDLAELRARQAPPAEARARLGFGESDLVMVYSGGLSHYQQVPAMLELWRGLLDQADLRFLLLTNESPHSAPSVVGHLGAFGERLVHLSLPRAEVPGALAACDAGFMLRDNRELNRVASPVKFPEYLAAGLAVVASPGTGDVSDLITELQLGALVDPARVDAGADDVRALLRRLRSERESLRERARALAASRYDWAAYATSYRAMYCPPDRPGTQP